MSKVKPLQCRTMTLEALQKRTLTVLRRVRKQFNRMPYEGGLSDREFLLTVLEPFETDIRQDMIVLKMNQSKT